MERTRTTLRFLGRFLLGAALVGPAIEAQSIEAWRKMNQPIDPFRIAGNLYYVGASDVTAFLITTPEGHILIDGGFRETVPLIRDSIETLGFKLERVRILLNSHAHLDHAGGLARLKELTGGQLFAAAPDVPLLERGGLGDDIMGDSAPFDAVRVDRALSDGEVVELGGMVLEARLTAGHTRGCTSWNFEVREGKDSYRVVSVCSLTALDGTRFTKAPTYPGIADDFRRSFKTLRSIPAEIFLASHGSFFGMQAKRERQKSGEAGNPFVEPGRERYMAYIDRAEKRFTERLEAEGEQEGD